MIYYSTGKDNYKRGEVGVAVECDEQTAKVLIEKGYLKANATVPQHKDIIVEEKTQEAPKVSGTVEVIINEEPKVKQRGNPAWRNRNK